jgi:UDP-N-acetylenolpyruvoylglucosamine reductase
MEWEGIRGTILKDVPMKRYTSMKVGGQAAYLVYPADETDLSAVLRFLKDKDVKASVSRQRDKCYSNDKGLDAALIRITKMRIYAT